MGKRGPQARIVSDAQQQLLSRVEAASEARRRADAAYASQVVEARAAGLTVAAIANAAGVSEGAVRQMVARHSG